MGESYEYIRCYRYIKRNEEWVLNMDLVIRIGGLEIMGRLGKVWLVRG